MDFATLCEAYVKLESTSKRLEKTRVMADLLKAAPAGELEALILLLRGKAFHDWDEKKLNVSTKILIKALSRVSGKTASQIEEEWKKIGDLGEVTEKFVGKKTQSTLVSEELSAMKVFSNVQKLATIEGTGSVDRKLGLIAELFGSAKGVEARFIARLVLEDLRVGVATGTLRDAIVWAFLYNPNYEEGKINPESREEYNKASKAVQDAYDKTNDFSVVAVAAKKGLEALAKLDIVLFKPMKVMLAQRVKTVEEGFKRVGTPAILEYKYDGFRLQIHKDADEVKLFTRRLDEVTNAFPDVVATVKKYVKSKKCILDAEAVGYDKQTKKYLPFQKIGQRIRRKYNIKEMSEQWPVEVDVFDVLYHEESLLAKSLEERRAILEKVIKAEPYLIKPSSQYVTDNEERAQLFYDEALKAGMEGLMIKNKTGIYQPGSRVGHWVKLKSVMDTVDLVVVGAEWGTGKRRNWLTSLTLAVQDEGELRTVGKVGTGLKELEQEGGVTFQFVTDKLKDHITSSVGREVEVKPVLLVEIAFEEIQRSPTYTSGYALRFPRVKGVREDKTAEDATTLEEIEELFEMQR